MAIDDGAQCLVEVFVRQFGSFACVWRRKREHQDALPELAGKLWWHLQIDNGLVDECVVDERDALLIAVEINQELAKSACKTRR